jgi:hypothetical protein
MAWDDIVFGVATGGLYNVGKTAYKAGEAAEQAGDAVEEIADGAGTALAAIGSTVTKLGKDLSSFITELEDLITIDRAAPRDENDLWDEEVERLAALRAKEAELLAKLAALDAEDDETSWFDAFWGAIFGSTNHEELVVRTKLGVVRNAIKEILYEEPGVVPNTVHNLQLILEHFNTMEQPRLDDILDSVDDNLEELHEIQQEVKKLFVVRTWKAVPIADLPAPKVQELEALEAKLVDVDQLIAKNSALSNDLRSVLVRAQPEKLRLPKFVGTDITFSGYGRLLASSAAVGGNDEAIDNPASGAHNEDDVLPSASDVTLRPNPGHQPAIRPVLRTGPSFGFKGKASSITTQPLAATVSTALKDNAVHAYMDTYLDVRGRVKLFQREKLKLEKSIFRIKFVAVEEPGVIPKTLEEVRQTIDHLNTETQPRIDTVLTSVDGTVVELTSVLGSVNGVLGSIQGALNFVANSIMVKIGLAVAGGLILLILLLGTIVLFRLAIGIGV